MPKSCCFKTFFYLKNICLFALSYAKNQFNIKYFIVALIPNVFPILVAIGILCMSDFYFSLSNAFIFAIVFGLIVDDSIHILSSYRFNIKKGMDQEKAIEKS